MANRGNLRRGEDIESLIGVNYISDDSSYDFEAVEADEAVIENIYGLNPYDTRVAKIVSQGNSSCCVGSNESFDGSSYSSVWQKPSFLKKVTTRFNKTVFPRMSPESPVAVSATTISI